ncbi:UvrD-helicase domain-containing protein [Candidatus Nitrosacidococcus sp. I8]|uniref:UvrD-helicase domain-containing protein n=1 Tax=Candidatus Nitrosacidococcus sp. I8 TaxID=2942908 RepID=UPI002225FAFD|nr:UvrD-helicase domain-containing protein [Candidatus Nitrosacidococcus sp. I8]CAH9018711.1 hypothetical protein NURINAE_01089 [Candidatus Nitrosacidococcus sp. I8]
MNLTEEQRKIIQAKGNLKINAVAGSGKTATIIGYAKSRPKESRILYLAFNKTVQQEAKEKFQQAGLSNAHAYTAHGLAYGYIMRNKQYQIKRNNYKTYEISELLNIDNGILNNFKKEKNKDKYLHYILANHIYRYMVYFCNSSEMNLKALDYLNALRVAKLPASVYTIVHQYYPLIATKAEEFFKKMEDGAIEITHDFYLKKFQLSEPKLPYDYILFDEGQDASEVMLDVFLKQNATKVIVGDAHQQIYGWRYAINSLEKVDYDTYHLTNSFRFPQNIAHLSAHILQFKNIFNTPIAPTITGTGKSQSLISKAVLARGNIALLSKAIELVIERKSANKIYFEGNINSYTYADTGGSLYDVLNLYHHNHWKIRDALIKKMESFADIKKYAEDSGDNELQMLIDLVEKYKNNLPDMIQTLKGNHVENKQDAEIIFSTVHRSKGMEYDQVEITEDFIDINTLKKNVNNELLTHFIDIRKNNGDQENEIAHTLFSILNYANTTHKNSFDKNYINLESFNQAKLSKSLNEIIQELKSELLNLHFENLVNLLLPCLTGKDQGLIKNIAHALKTRAIEEINVLYVAVTRTKNKLFIPSKYLPEALKEAKQF